MARVIAITQFVFLALGVFTLKVIVKATVAPPGTEEASSPLSLFLANYGGWMLTIPLLWMVYMTICQYVKKGIFSETVANGVGILIATAILAVYSYAIFFGT